MDNDVLSWQLANQAQLLAEPSRMKILLTLMDGRAYTATELAVLADIAPSTASSHLQRLTQGELIRCIAQGKHRYFSLANTEVAEFLENQLAFSTQLSPKAISTTPKNLRYSRTCYQHLAGELAVALAQEMLKAQWIDPSSMNLTQTGHAALTQKGIALVAWEHYPAQVCTCLDWSERQFHIGKSLGKQLLQFFLQKNYFNKIMDSRQLQITPKGQKALLNGRFTQI